jgi:xanthine dehydrogenase molybdopterin-binding subunit B
MSLDVRLTPTISHYQPTPCIPRNIISLDLAAARAAPGVVTIAMPTDVPGENNHGSIIHDDPIFTNTLVQYAGQPIFAVAAVTCIAARKAAARAQIAYAELPPVLDIRSTLAAQNYVVPSRNLLRGNPDEAMASAPHPAMRSPRTARAVQCPNSMHQPRPRQLCARSIAGVGHRRA